MVNPSLGYEILLYLNSFYFGMFATCELGMMTLKAVNLEYKKHDLAQDVTILLILCIIESVRIVLGRKGSLSDHGKWIFQFCPYLDILNNLWEILCLVSMETFYKKIEN